jgi:hypothetical protein
MIYVSSAFDFDLPRIPDLDGPVFTPRHDPFSLSRVCQRGNVARMSFESRNRRIAE